jgi:hypothetical protein
LATKTVGVQRGEKLATLFQGVGHGGVLGGMESLEREVFQLCFEAPYSELAGEGDIDVLCRGRGRGRRVKV